MNDDYIFDTMAALIRNFGGLKENNWLNQELEFYLKKKRYKAIKPHTLHLPHMLRNLTFECSNGHVSRPNWMEKVPPKLPFEPKCGGCVIPQDAESYFCPECAEKIVIPIIQKPYQGTYCLYGDEAEREVKGSAFILYTFLGVSTGEESGVEADLIEQFLDLKRNYNPKIEPDQWVVHLKDAFSSKYREDKLSPYARDSKLTVNFVNDILSLLGGFNNKNLLNTYVSYSSHIVGRVNPLNIKRLVSGSALLTAVGDAAQFGLGTRFFFERTGRDGWLTDYVKSLQTTRFWPLVTQCHPFQSPRMVEPNYHPFLELADVICYVLARNYFTEQQNKKCDFDIRNLGHCSYIRNTELGWDRVFSDRPKF